MLERCAFCKENPTEVGCETPNGHHLCFECWSGGGLTHKHTPAGKCWFCEVKAVKDGKCQFCGASSQ